ncbi:MAG TPA: carboxymuconolactone decarboxylase family protein [Bryobacteraceae bacterium]|nr:carboxymuconolactone decarboxylase family protein [Bryobacteraceae bacterium]
MRNSDEKRGMALRRKVLGDLWVDRSLAKRNDFNSDFQDFVTRYVWGEIWSRPAIDQYTRRCMVLSTMLALGSWDEFKLHVRGALRDGMSKDVIKEIILQSTIYCGVPAGNHAMNEAESVFAEGGH